jgi:hypothetical protein
MFEDEIRTQHHHFRFTGLELAQAFLSKLKRGDFLTDSPLATSETQIEIVFSFLKSMLFNTHNTANPLLNC